MTPGQMAALHARAMTIPRPWTAREFADLLASQTVFFTGGPAGFALGRTVLDEAELLTLAVDPDRRREGLGRSCLAAFEAEARGRGAVSCHLEVAADNIAAASLYEGAGYVRTGVRQRYYAVPGSGAIDAHLYRKILAGA